MTRIKVRGIKRYFEPKTGKVYCYHRKTLTRITSPLGTPEFFAEIAAAELRLKTKPAPRPGSLGLIIQAYRASPAFTSLKPLTKRDYERVLDYLRPMETASIADLTPADIVAIRERTFKLRRRSFANYVLAALSILFAFSIERGWATTNPVRQVKKIRRHDGDPHANRAWSRDQWQIVITRAPAHLALPLSIARWTGLREGDVLRLPRNALDGETIKISTAKRGVKVTLPICDTLRDALNRQPSHSALTLCANSRGRPCTNDCFRTSLFKFIRGLEAEGVVDPGLTFHGLRTTVATELRELGLGTRVIADVLGQRTEAMSQHYSRDADLGSAVKNAIKEMELANTAGTKVSRKRD